LPFCNLRLEVPRGPDFPIAYERHPKTLGEHLRKERLLRGLKQRDVAVRLGVRTETVANWERGQERPLARHHGTIIRFLGFDPEPAGDTLPARLRAVRRRLGLTQGEIAARLGQDEHQICRWEGGRQRPHPWIAGRIELGLRVLEGRNVDGLEQPLSYFDLTRWRRRRTLGLAAAKPSTIGEHLREVRLRLGISQEAAGRLLGVSRGVIYRIERGVLRPEKSLVRKFQNILESIKQRG
jgi:transcriptional regulator with XRE-family HTH domain